MGEALVEEPSEEEEQTPSTEKDQKEKGFFTSILPDARHVHRIKTAERWSYTETLRKFSEELKEEGPENGELNSSSMFETHNHKLWRPKGKGAA